MAKNDPTIKEGPMQEILRKHKNKYIGADLLALLVSCLVLFLIYKPFLNMPPVWDAVAGVFSPAIYLYEHGYDLLGLLKLHGYLQGGPNVHSLSIITWLTAFFMDLFGGKPSQFLLALHMVNIFLGGGVISLAFSLVRRVSDIKSAFVVALLLMVSPLLGVQISYVYMEVAGCIFALLSFYCLVWKKVWCAVIFALMALSVKSLGLVVVAAVGFFVMLDSYKLGITWCWQRLSVLMVPAGLLEYARFSFGHGEKLELTTESYSDYLYQIYSRLCDIPDLKILIGLFFLVSFCVLFKFNLFSVKGIKIFFSEKLEEELVRFYLAGISIVFLFFCFVIFVPLSGSKFFPLTRYYVWVLPALISLVVVFFSGLLRNRSSNLKFSAVAILVLYFFVSKDGLLYPGFNSGTSSFSRLERSFEYLDFYKLQEEGVKLVAEEFPDEIVYVTRGEYYMLSSPLMGYADIVPENVRFLLADENVRKSLADYPDRFLLLDTNSNGYHGQGLLYSIVTSAQNKEEYDVVVLRRFNIFSYSGQVISVTRRNKENT